MHIFLRLILIISAFILSVAEVSAYDFSGDNSDGKTIYYNITGPENAEVTYKTRFRGTDSYEGHLEIPAQVEAEGIRYKVTGLGENALFGCRDLTSVGLPKSLTSIGARAFAWCDAIERIKIPKSVEMIGSNVFDGCYALTEIDVEGGNSFFSDKEGVLYNKNLSNLVAYTPAAEGAYTVYDGAEAIGDNAFAACTFLTGISLPESLTSIGSNAFYFCNFLSGVTIPAGVSEIGHAAFADCLSLRYINVDAGNAAYQSVEGVLYDKPLQKLIQSPGALLGSPDIPTGVTYIGDEAFFRNYTLTTIKLPESMTGIGEAAFIDCPKLSSVEIPASVTEIGAMAFALCPSLSSVYVNAADPSDIILGDDVFYGVDRYRSTLFVPAGSESLYAEAPQWRDFPTIRPTTMLKEQNISWEATTDSLLTATQHRLEAISSSGLPVHYVLSVDSKELALISDRTLLILLPGTITVTAYQPGNIEYLPAAPVTRTYNAKLNGLDDMLIDSDIKVYAAYGAIVIKDAPDDAVAQICDINGITLYTGTDRYIPVQPGAVYIVRIGMQSFKVAVIH